MRPDQNDFIKQLYQDNFLKLMVYVSTSLKNTSRAQDIVQDTFHEAIHHIDILMQHPNPGGWLRMTAKYKVREEQREMNKYAAYFISLDSDLLTEPGEEDPRLAQQGEPDAAPVLLLEKIKKILTEEEYRLLKRLTIDGVSHVKAAEEFGISVYTSQKRLERIRKKLKKDFQKNKISKILSETRIFPHIVREEVLKMVNKNEYESGTYWDQLSTEQLEDILRADIASPNQTNDETVFHILEVLEKREKENPSGRLPDTDQAWKEFQQYYNIPEGEGQSLYPVRSDPETQPAPTSTKKNRRFRPRKVLVVVAVLVLMFGSMLTAQAAGVDVFGAIGRWTEEKFHFEITPASEDGTTDYTFREASRKRGLPQSLIPTWYPKGFESSEPIDDSVEDYVDSVYCEYINKEENRSYSVMVSRYYDSNSIAATVYEKDDTKVEIYENNGRNFYIMSNLDTLTATWSDGKMSIDISGQLEINELKHIIDSIGE